MPAPARLLELLDHHTVPSKHCQKSVAFNLRKVPEITCSVTTFYRLPKEHHKHLKSTNVLERLNQELKRRTQVIRIFPHPESCLRLVRALAVEIHEAWLESPRYLNMEPLAEQKKSQLRGLDLAAA